MLSTNKHARLAAGSILRSAKNMKAKINDAVDDATNAAVVAAVKHKENDNYTKSAVLAAIILAAHRLSHTIELAVINGRQEARDLGAVRLASELAAAGVVVGAAQLGTYEHREDEARGSAAGQTLGSTWQTAMTYAVIHALRNDEDTVKKMTRAKMVMGSKVDRTVETEASTAFNSERKDGLKAAVAEDAELATKIAEAKLGRRWDAMLDACSDCQDHDGEVVGINESFSGGAEPGWQHINCRCVDTIVSLADELAA